MAATGTLKKYKIYFWRYSILSSARPCIIYFRGTWYFRHSISHNNIHYTHHTVYGKYRHICIIIIVIIVVTTVLRLISRQFSFLMPLRFYFLVLFMVRNQLCLLIIDS